MPQPSFLAALLARGRLAPFLQRRLLLLGGGGALLLLLLALQSALESAGPSGEPVPTVASRADGALPDYSAFATSAPPETDWLLLLSGLALKLIVVALLIYATVWLLKRFLGRPAAAAPAGGLSLAQSLSLAPHQQVHLLRVGERTLLIGATPQQITLLAEIDEEASPDALRPAEDEPAAPARSFAEHLAALTTDPVAATAGQYGARRAGPPRRSAAAGDPPAEQTSAPEQRAAVEAALTRGQQALAQRLTALGRDLPPASRPGAADARPGRR